MPSLFELADGQTCTVAGKYEASQRIGKGRFAYVFRAYDRKNARDVALKAYFSADEATRGRCATEEQVLRDIAALNSPFFPKLIQSLKTLVESEYYPLLVLELGEYNDPALPQKSVVSLRDVFDAVAANRREQGHAAFWQAGPLREFCLDLCQAVADLHSLDRVHRDLKPSNILLKRAPGSNRTYPFVLDFNAVGESSEGAGGTKSYLPPEVTHGSRDTHSPADDVWAVSRLVWELYFGEGSAPVSGVQPTSKLASPPPDEVVDVLRKALSPNPADRYPDASALREHLEAGFGRGLCGGASDGSAVKQPVNPPTDRDRFHDARGHEDRIRYSVIYTLESGDAPPVPKEIRELVALALDTNADASSTAIDLKADLLAIGPRAFPAILEQSYRVKIDGKEWSLCLDALEALALADRPLADKSLEYYCVSSAYAVRSMCKEVCDRLSFVPRNMVSLYINDDGLLSPDESDVVLDLLLRYAVDDKVFALLVGHMCKCMVGSATRYRELRDSIALRLVGLPAGMNLNVLRTFAMERPWTDLSSYRSLRPGEASNVDRSVLGLLAEAFASHSSAGEKLVAWHRDAVSSRQTRPSVWMVWLEFMKKTIVGDPSSEARFVALAAQSHDLILAQELDRIRNTRPMPVDEIPDVLERYLDGRDVTRPTFNKLRFDKSATVVRLLRDRLESGVNDEELERAFRLLEGFESRARSSVVRCVLENWSTMKAYDLARACNILTQAVINQGQLLDDVVASLNRELRTGGDERVREAMNVVLSWK